MWKCNTESIGSASKSISYKGFKILGVSYKDLQYMENMDSGKTLGSSGGGGVSATLGPPLTSIEDIGTVGVIF